VALGLTAGSAFVSTGEAQAADPVAICEIQAADSTTGFSPLEGQRVEITGVVTVPPGIFVPQHTSIYVTGVGDDSCGINVFGFDLIQDLGLGDTVVVEGEVGEYVSTSGYGASSQVMFDSPSDISVTQGTGSPVPTVMFTGQAAREENEGRLVTVVARITGPVSTDDFTVDDGTGPIEVYDRGGVFSRDTTWARLNIGDQVTVTGVISQSDRSSPYLEDYTIWPRGPEYGDLVAEQCIPGGEPEARLSLNKGIFCPEAGENVTIVYNGPHQGRIRLRIYDVYGRTAATLDDRISLCGETEIKWDGRNELRELLPMGLYHVVVTAHDPDGGQTQEIVPVVIGRRLK
jgi:uncharacterized protein YdeI (BOF family)